MFASKIMWKKQVSLWSKLYGHTCVRMGGWMDGWLNELMMVGWRDR
jgi:hypothetical protein